MNKKKESGLPPYNSNPISPEEEPNYRELYFNLLENCERARTFIKIIMDESMKDFNKSFKPTYINIDKRDI